MKISKVGNNQAIHGLIRQMFDTFSGREMPNFRIFSTNVVRPRSSSFAACATTPLASDKACSINCRKMMPSHTNNITRPYKDVP